jgi:hypothetical protein
VRRQPVTAVAQLARGGVEARPRGHAAPGTLDERARRGADLVGRAPGAQLGGQQVGLRGNRLLREFRALNKEFWGRHLWARGYFAASSGNVTDDVIKKYIACLAGTTGVSGRLPPA